MKSIEEIAVKLTEQRKKLGIEQKDMYMRIGMKQQQYQRVEAGSDVKLSTLLRVLEGLDLELSIVPKGRKAPSIPVDKAPVSQSEEALRDDTDDLGFWFGSEDEL
ncbi:helix-turn-helix transcriptional regulator [Vibrio sp. JC009]|uniref:helix-turn-helix domain-containing protein n=1 Tax=Vibrio sp. JC009 TaxID=2912314 RepID=UPI0023AF2470|nr:helix-turn-helix transcriptional regulator [Vibrio sp. JC009]WED22794.1 helix-turn-helix transcriptional regulator [Vibrio sp. JC009]